MCTSFDFIVFFYLSILRAFMPLIDTIVKRRRGGVTVEEWAVTVEEWAVYFFHY